MSTLQNITNEQVNQMLVIERYYSNEETVSRIVEMRCAYAMGDGYMLDKILATFPQEDCMMDSLYAKLKHKSIGKTMRRVSEGKADLPEKLKMLFSLGTHVIIEMDKQPEYQMLLHTIYQRLGSLLEDLANET